MNFKILIAIITCWSSCFAAPIALTLDKSDEGCTWRLTDVKTKISKLFLKTKECPYHILHDQVGKKIIFNLDQLYSYAYTEKKAVPVSLGKLPDDAGPGKFFMSSDHKILYAHVEEVTSPEIIKGKDIFHKRGTEPINFGDKDSLAGPAHFAVLIQLEKNGKWIEKEVAPTSSGACGSAGIDGLKHSLKTAKHSQVVTDTHSFANIDLKLIRESKLSEISKNELLSLFPKPNKDRSDDAEAMFSFGKNLIVFYKRSIEGSEFPTQPIYICDESHKASNCKRILSNDDQVGHFSMQSSYLAIDYHKREPAYDEKIFRIQSVAGEEPLIIKADSFYWLDDAEPFDSIPPPIK